MLQNWFSPSKVHEGKEIENWKPGSIGSSLTNYTDFLTDASSAKVALIGYDKSLANKVRMDLYSLASTSSNCPLVDLGNIRNDDASFAIQAIKAGLAHGVIPIVIGGPASLHRIMYEAFQDYEKQVNLALVSDRFDLMDQDEEYWKQVLSGEAGHMYQFNLLGHQSHFLTHSQNTFLKDWALEELRLGEIHSAPENSEPAVRNADLVLMDINAVRYSDAPNQSQPNPNGLFGEEFCQIAKYAGISDKSKAFGIFGASAAEHAPQMTTQLMAQAIWYFMDGIQNRKLDFPISSRHLTEYMVDIKDFDEQISFWKSGLTGRWWVQLPTTDSDTKPTSEMIPCVYEDYQLASREEISERVFRALKRLG